MIPDDYTYTRIAVTKPDGKKSTVSMCPAEYIRMFRAFGGRKALHKRIRELSMQIPANELMTHTKAIMALLRAEAKTKTTK